MEHKEMNLFDLCAAMCRGIGKGIMWVIYRLGDMIRLSFRQWWIVLLAVVLCVALALYYSRFENRIYKVNAVAMLHGVTNEMVRSECENLSKAVPLFQHQNLSQLLAVDEELARTNFQFEAFDVIDILGDSTIDVIDYNDSYSRLDTLYVRMGNMVALQFRTKTPDRVPEMQTALLNYLNTRPYFQLRYEKHKINIEREARFHHDQLEKLDSLTSVFYFSNNAEPQMQMKIWESGMVLGRREIELFLEDIYSAMRVKSHVDASVASCTAPVVLRSSFVINPRAVNGPLRMTALAIIVGWLLGLAIAAIVENRKRILSWLRHE